MKEIYDKVNLKSPPPENPKWYRVQKLAFEEGEASMKELTALVLEADSKSVQLPVVRIAQRSRKFGTGNKTWTVNKDDTIILDIVCPDSLCYDKANCACSHKQNFPRASMENLDQKLTFYPTTQASPMQFQDITSSILQ